MTYFLLILVMLIRKGLILVMLTLWGSPRVGLTRVELTLLVFRRSRLTLWTLLRLMTEMLPRVDWLNDVWTLFTVSLIRILLRQLVSSFVGPPGQF